MYGVHIFTCMHIPMEKSWKSMLCKYKSIVDNKNTIMIIIIILMNT